MTTLAPPAEMLTALSAPPLPNREKQERVRLDFLDGLRGLTAVYVVLHHAWLFTGYDLLFQARHYSLAAKALLSVVQYGYYSVAVFIVLSGFVLGVPVAQTADKILKGGFVGYIKRRGWRILPPYYAALLLFILLIAVTPILQTAQNTAWDSKIPMTWSAIVSHLFLVHNLNGEWTLKIDGPLWSVATEWQIYFLYPAILLPVWRRFGFAAMAMAGFAAGLLLQFVSKASSLIDLSGAAPQYVGLFAFGVAASAVAFSQEPLAVWLRERVPWRAVSLTAVILLIATYWRFGGWLTEKRWAGDSLVGLVVSTLILVGTLHLQRGGRPGPLLRVLSSPLSLWLGLFSYSIYLIHSPLLGLFNLLTLHFALSDDVRLALMWCVAVPMTIGVSYVFHLLVERRFLTEHQRNLKKTLDVK